MTATEVAHWKKLFAELLLIDAALQSNTIVGSRYTLLRQALERGFKAIGAWNSKPTDDDESFVPVKAYYEIIIATYSLMHLPSDVSLFTASPLLITLHHNQSDTLRELLQAGAAINKGVAQYAIDAKDLVLLELICTHVKGDANLMPVLLDNLDVKKVTFTPEFFQSMIALLLRRIPAQSINASYSFRLYNNDGYSYTSTTYPLNYAMQQNSPSIVAGLLTHPEIVTWPYIISNARSSGYQAIVKLMETPLIEAFYQEVKTSADSPAYDRVVEFNIPQSSISTFFRERAQKPDYSIENIQEDIKLIQAAQKNLYKFLTGHLLHRERNGLIDDLKKEVELKRTKDPVSTSAPVYKKHTPALSSSSSSSSTSNSNNKKEDPTQSSLNNRDL